MSKFIHADLIVQYAQDAAEVEEPWLRWQYKHALSDGWKDATNPIAFNPDIEYRRKPRTININGYEVPEPVREPLEDGQECWLADVTYETSQKCWWDGRDDLHLRWLADGLIHLSKGAAQQHIDAMLSFTRRGGE